MLRVLAGPTSNGDVTEGPTLGSITTASLVEVTRLREVVVVVVTELGVGGVAPWAWQRLGLARRRMAHALLGPGSRSPFP